MTQTPGGAGGIISIVVTIEYGVLWTASNGNIPTIGSLESDLENTLFEIPWPTSGSFNGVNFSTDPDFIYEITNQFVTATVISKEKTVTTSLAEDGITEVTTVEYGPPVPVAYYLNNFSVVSAHESNNRWIYPDDYNAIVDANYPKQYGGVVLFGDSESGFKDAGTIVEAGCDKDAEYTFIDTNGNEQIVISGYNYFECFEKGDYRYKPRNSVALNLVGDFDAKDIIIPSRPYFKDLLDEDKKHVPIYPLDIVTAFNVDLDQLTVTVTYTFTLDANHSLIEGGVVDLINPVLTMTQTVTQPASVSERLQKLLDLCSYTNPDGYPFDSLGNGYTIDYPYTMVTGYDGIGTTPPNKRGTDVTRYGSSAGQTLKRGDVWYNPANDQRKYWKGADMVDSIKIVNAGTNYTSRKNVQVYATIEVSPDDTEDVEMRTPFPYGLYVDITADDNGQIVSASIVDGYNGHNFQDGDIVAVPGGNGNARLKVHIFEPNRWVNFYVSRY